MLHLVYGRAGSGKTRYARELLASLCENGAGNLLLLTPEQVSFESERAMLRRLGPRRAQGVQVLSFTRLANTVFRQFGGLAGKRLDDGGRTILMSLALEEMADTLQLFRPQAKSGEMIQLLLQSSAELKMSAVSPEALRQAAYFFVAGRVHMPRKGEGRFPFRLHLAKLCGVVKAAAQKLCKLL